MTLVVCGCDYFLDGEPLDHKFLVRLMPAIGHFHFFFLSVLLIVTGEWKLLVVLTVVQFAVTNERCPYVVTGIILRVYYLGPVALFYGLRCK